MRGIDVRQRHLLAANKSRTGTRCRKRRAGRRAKPLTLTIGGKEYLTFPDGFADQVRKSTRTVRRWNDHVSGRRSSNLATHGWLIPTIFPAGSRAAKDTPATAPCGNAAAARRPLKRNTPSPQPGVSVRGRSPRNFMEM